jgi:Ca2+/Na+ antiporter
MKVNDMVGNCKIIARIKNLLKENKLYLSLLGGVLGGFYMADQMNYIRYDLLSQSQNNILLVRTGLGFFFAIYLGHMLEIYRKTVNEISSVFVEAKQYKSFKRRAIFAIIIWFFMITVAVFGRLESSLIAIILFIMFFFCLLFLHKTGEKLSDIDEIVKDLFKAIVGSGKNIEKIEDLYKKIKPKAMKDKALAINVIHYSNKYLINNETFINRLKNEISEECKEVEKNIQENKPFSFIGERLHNNVFQSLSSIIKEHCAKCRVESISEIFNILVSVYSQTLSSKQR